MTTAPFDLLGIVCALAIAALVLRVVYVSKKALRGGLALVRQANFREAEANTRANIAEAEAAILRERLKWRTVTVDGAGRGPNADCSYRVPPPDNDGHEAWFTAEATAAAKTRPSIPAARTYSA